MRDNPEALTVTRVGQPDFTILIMTSILLGFGLIMVYSASQNVAYFEYGDSAYFLKRQLVSAFLGLILLYITLNIPFTFYRKLVPLILFGLLLMMVLVLIPGIGIEEMGARRWLNLKVITVQPSEFVKLGLIIYLASLYAKKQDYISNFSRGVLPPLTVAAIFCGLTLLQRDLGTTTILMMFTLVILFCAGAKISQLALLGAAGGALFVFFAVSQPYRLKRLTSFIDPWSDPTDSGYQLIQSLYAIGNGGLWGAGFNNSVQKQFYLPFPHTDFIFAVIAEEWGFIGVVLVLTAFLVLVLKGIQVSLRCPQPFGKLLGVGLSSMIALQVLVNIGVTAGMLPVTGLTLPLISYGGSSLLLTLMSIGILLNISRYDQRYSRKENQSDAHEQSAV